MSSTVTAIDPGSIEVIGAQIRVGAVFSRRSVTMNALAAIVASYGILTNSMATVIGAMVIARLIDSISGVALSLVEGDTRLLRASLASGAAGASVVLVISFVIGWIHRDFPSTELMLRLSHPTLPDLIVALAGGAAGAYATVSARISASLVGVAIATAMVPPLATCGIYTAKGQYVFAAGALELFIANFAAIQLSMSVVLWASGFRGRRGDSATIKQMLTRNAPTILALVCLFALLWVNFVRAARDQVFEANVRRSLQQFATAESMDVLQVTFSHRQDDGTGVIVTFASLEPLQKQAIDRFQSQLSDSRGRTVQLDVRYIIANTIDAGRDGQPAVAAPTSVEPPEIPRGEVAK